MAGSLSGLALPFADKGEMQLLQLLIMSRSTAALTEIIDHMISPQDYSDGEVGGGEELKDGSNNQD